MIDCGMTFAEIEILMKLEAKFWKHRLNHFVNRLTIWSTWERETGRCDCARGIKSVNQDVFLALIFRSWHFTTPLS